MQFREADIESAYREHFQGRSRFEEKIAAPHYSVLVDIAVGSASMLLICLALVYTFGAEHWPALIYSLIAVLSSLAFFVAALYWTLYKNILLISGWVLRYCPLQVDFDWLASSVRQSLACTLGGFGL